VRQIRTTRIVHTLIIACHPCLLLEKRFQTEFLCFTGRCVCSSPKLRKTCPQRFLILHQFLLLIKQSSLVCTTCSKNRSRAERLHGITMTCLWNTSWTLTKKVFSVKPIFHSYRISSYFLVSKLVVDTLWAPPCPGAPTDDQSFAHFDSALCVCKTSQSQR